MVLSLSHRFDRLRRVIEWLVPPIQARRANRIINQRLEKDFAELVNAWTIESKNPKVDSGFFASRAKDLFVSEMERKNVIEQKASSLLGVAGLALTLTSIGLTLSGRDLGVAPWEVLVAMIFLSVAILHFIASGYYAVRAMEVSSIRTPSTSELRECLLQGHDAAAVWGALYLADTEKNYESTLIRSNCLSVSQTMFMRGLIILGVGSILLFIFLVTTSTLHQTSGNFTTWTS